MKVIGSLTFSVTFIAPFQRIRNRRQIRGLIIFRTILEDEKSPNSFSFTLTTFFVGQSLWDLK
jgi:hypothetical protein